jgi:hypothetical protein
MINPLLIAAAILIAGVPLAAVVLVSVASWREESARSLTGRAPGPLTHAARRLLAFHSDGVRQPSSRDKASRQPEMSGRAGTGRRL